MSPAFIKDKGWKMAESMETNGVLDGHALAFDIVDPNAPDEEEVYDEEIAPVEDEEYEYGPEEEMEEEYEEQTVIVN